MQDYLRDYLNANKILFKKQEVGRYFVSSGWPDFAIFPGLAEVFFIEVKAPGGKPTPMQAHVHKQLRGKGYWVYVVDNKDEGRAIIDKECKL